MIENDIWTQELLEAGFKKESPALSVKVLHPGFQYTKEVFVEGQARHYEFGLFLNHEAGGMQLFDCDCTLSCCGTEVTQGITPYSLDKVNQLIEDFIKEYS